MLTQHLNEDPAKVKSGIETVAESLRIFVRECMKLGVDGFYASTQGGEADRFEDPSVFEQYIKPTDLMLMEEFSQSCPFNILHVCDYHLPYDDLTSFLDYPGHVVNSALGLGNKELTCRELSDIFGRPFMGGMDRKGAIAKGDREAIVVQVEDLIEHAPEGVGRRVDIVKAVSEATQFPIVVATGLYHEPQIPEWALNASEDDLSLWMLGELTGQISYGGSPTGVQAAWIKLSASDDGITQQEAKILRAASHAGSETGAVIGSHTIRGSVVHDQLNILEDAGYRGERYIWIHAQSDTYDLNLEVAQRGAWISYDGLGNQDWLEDEEYISRIERLWSAGFGEQILLSHDRGWYQPGQPNGGVPQPFTYLVYKFLPKLYAAGFDEAMVQQMTERNPYQAFAR